ncbi:glycosyltransferase family 4 protein [Marinobacter nanhaiticus D15-8W]|uniref:Glycosyltransferase n=1 Tax=Marinobacter nanhaiticus D15-8W TaxID=626887 RepID=N6W3T4_9GAMM|nr:glycosyltransferase family 4 protein [Marinobacter nanhaiticus]ENO14789.1 glycosyltransferase [Marinobacter nanhaiticus D15-8W]BES69522.1 glycosyltransferase family 4 protein [Marinobacter nanhaiticus D15-8W]
MVNVTHVVRQYLPSIGGMEDVVRNIAVNQLAQTGVQPRVITLDRLFRQGENALPKEEEIDGIQVTRLPYFGSTRYPVCPRILQEIRKADAVHVHGVDFFYDFLAATKWIHRRPLLLSTHGGFFHTDFASRLKQLWFQTITRASSTAYERIIATSENDGQMFRQVVTPSRLKVIENGVDTAKYAQSASPDLRKTLIYFGRWSSNKGLMESLDFVQALNERDPGWTLIVAGREYDYSIQALQKAAAERGQADAVRIEPNPTNERLRALIGEASYFLCLSRHEGFGLAAIEAMSAGLTPVLNGIPPFQRLVDESHIGLIVERSRPGDGARNLLELHDQGQAAAAERRRHAMAFADRYSWHRIANDYFDIYRQLDG